ncbi:amino acid ABC transporter permease [Propionibacteriaceae bacterium Y1685]|uniref:amino acid ABC transporter permease n=1 Tax=Microlunatus sp. Y1700 TaxID=3418487 RepID=UPI003B818972
MGKFGQMLEQFDLLHAFWVTIQLSLLGALGALVIGTLVAIMRVSPVRSLQLFGAGYVNIIRNTPLTLLLFFCWFGLRISMGFQLGLPSDPSQVHSLRWAVVAVAVYHASFVAEAIRSGVNTVPQGQAEAARAIGLGFFASLRHVVLPQAFRGAVAPLGNVLIALIKNTTVAATIGLYEAAYTMKGMIEFYPQMLYVIFGLIALGFIILTLPTGIFFTSLSRKVAVQR